MTRAFSITSHLPFSPSHFPFSPNILSHTRGYTEKLKKHEPPKKGGKKELRKALKEKEKEESWRAKMEAEEQAEFYRSELTPEETLAHKIAAQQ